MKTFTSFVLLFLGNALFFAQVIEGTVSTEGVPLPGVLIVNVSSGARAASAENGSFSISAKVGEELRFVKAGYERVEIKVNSLEERIEVSLIKIPTVIEEVEVSPMKISGFLGKDVGQLSKNETPTQRAKNSIGLPGAPEKPREHATTSAKEVLLPMLLGQLNVQGMYDLISGDGRRKQSLYDFEDRQSELGWVRSRLTDTYFLERGIPQNRIMEFLQFAFARNLRLSTYAKAKNLSGAMTELEEPIEVYLSRLKENS